MKTKNLPDLAYTFQESVASKVIKLQDATIPDHIGLYVEISKEVYNTVWMSK